MRILLTSVEPTRIPNCYLVHGTRLCTACKQRLMQQLPVLDGWASAVSAKSIEALMNARRRNRHC